jgi:hypothetical protein
MQFSQNRPTDTVISDLAKANPGHVSTNTMLYCFLNVLAAVVKVKFDHLLDAWERATYKTSENVINTINECRINISHGHKISRGHPDDKPKGLPFFIKAMDALKELSKIDGFPAWLLIPLMTEVKGREGSLYFYCENYAEADKIFLSAELELSEIMLSDEWPFEGIYDKEIALRGFHLASFLVHSTKRGVIRK